jgi:hypothetical protein
MVNLEPNVMVYMLVLVLTHPTFGVIVAMENLHVTFPTQYLLIKFGWKRIAVMERRAALDILWKF